LRPKTKSGHGGLRRHGLLEYYKNQLQMAKLDQWQQMQKLQEQYGFDFSNIKSLVNSGYMYEIFGTYQASAEEFAVSDELCHQAAESTDTALLVIGRNSGGEECDRHVDNDYYLTSQEKELAGKICRDFAHVILVVLVSLELSREDREDSYVKEKRPYIIRLLLPGNVWSFMISPCCEY